MVKQGNIIMISFDPGVGHEQRMTRPALVVSTNSITNIAGILRSCARYIF